MNMVSDLVNTDDVFKIMIATDIHLGYKETDPIRGEDSFNSFEEILQLSQENDVDFLLLGGDLFHDNKPSPKCLHRCIHLLRKHCMGDRPISVQFLSDQAENFQHCFNPIVNYEDPNLNISIPVYSIHGNHDDPSGYGRTCALDLLSVSGLVNYFGKWTDLTNVKISPLLMKKGVSKLAIYGLSYIKDERLSRLFRDKKVQVLRPREDSDSWFNVFVLHQNRADRGPNNYLPEEVLPEFLDLVFWGHEHECRIAPEYNASNNFYVTQPGSPVATSLCEGEAVEKKVALLQVYKKEFKLTPIKLKTVRPFVFDSVILSECSLNQTGTKLTDEIQVYLTERIEKMIEKSQMQLTGQAKQPVLPLMRLRVEYSNESQCFNVIRFGQTFTEQIANPVDAILLRKLKSDTKRTKEEAVNKEAMQAALDGGNEDESVSGSRVEFVVERYFKEKNLKVLSVKGMGEAVTRFIDKYDEDAIKDITRHQIERTVEYLNSKNVNDERIYDEVENFRQLRLLQAERETLEARQVLECRDRSLQHTVPDDVVRSADDSEESGGELKPAVRGRGGGGARGRGGRGATTPVRARGGRRGARALRGSRGGGLPDALKMQQQSIHDSFLSHNVSRASTRNTSTRNLNASRKVIYISDSD